MKDENGLLVITQAELAERALQKTPSAMHIAVDNFLSSPKYDEVVLNLKALKQIAPSDTQVTDDKIILANKSGVQNIDFKVVNEVDFIHHDQRIGSATMATSMFKDRIKKAAKKTPVKNVGIDELEDSEKHLVIVTEEAEKNLRLRYTNVQILVVSNLLDDDMYDSLLAHLN